MLMNLAFETLTAVDLVRLLRFLPWLRQLFGTPTLDSPQAVDDYLRGRNSEPWQSVGPAQSIFELVKGKPTIARRLLAAYPDALLKITLPEAVERELGEVVLTPSGLIVAGNLISDPDTTIDVIRSPRGSGWQLVLGQNRVNLDRKMPTDVLNLIWGWVRYRVTKLLPQAEQADQARPDRVARTPLLPRFHLLALPDSVLCRTGRLGERWDSFA